MNFNAADAERAPSLELSVASFEHAWRVSTLGGFIFGRGGSRTKVSMTSHKIARGTLLIASARTLQAACRTAGTPSAADHNRGRSDSARPLSGRRSAGRQAS